MNIEQLRKEILQTIEGLKDLGADIDLGDFESLSSEDIEEDNEAALAVLRSITQGLQSTHEQRNKVAARNARKPKEEEPAPPSDDDDAVETKAPPKRELKKLNRPAAPKLVEPEEVEEEDAVPADADAEDDDLPAEKEESNLDNDEDDDTPDSDTTDDDDDDGAIVDVNRKIDDNDDTDYEHHDVAMPLTINSKLAKAVTLANTDDVEEYYALLLRLRRKLDALEEFADDGDALVVKLLNKTYLAYEAALEHLEDIADDTFPVKLDKFGNTAKVTLIEQLTEIGSDGKKSFLFDTKNANFSRFVRIEDASVVYSYVLHLRKVKDATGFIAPDYILIVSQKMHLSEEDQERGVPPRPYFYVTRLLRENHDYHLGHEFKTTSDLQVRIKKLLAFDNLRTDIEKINIPFSQKELSKKFVSEHVRKVTVDDENHKIVVLLKKGTTQEDVNLLIPDFMHSLGAIVNLKKLAIKYYINITVPSVEFVILHKTKDKSIINRSQLEDMKERYDLTDEAFRSLVKALTIGN